MSPQIRARASNIDDTSPEVSSEKDPLSHKNIVTRSGTAANPLRRFFILRIVAPFLKVYFIIYLFV
jgi:hypothetical protein